MKIDKNTEAIINPLQDLEKRSYDLRKQHNTSFLTFIGFIIATGGIIISLDITSKGAIYLLCLSIIFLVLGFTISFNYSAREIVRLDKSIKHMSEWNISDNVGDIQDEVGQLNQVWKKSNIEKIFEVIYTILQCGGILLFIAGIITFMCSIN